MRILVLHRYPINLAIGTNPSFPSMFSFLREKADEVIFLSFKGNSKTEYPDIIFNELRFSFDRGNAFDKWVKTVLWLFCTPFAVRRIIKNNNINLIYCDDSIPFYPLLIKVFARPKCKVVMRLGDLQTGYIFDGQGIIRQMLFWIFHVLEVFAWHKIDRIIAISGPFKNYVEQKNIDPEKVSIIRESIDLDSFFPASSDLRELYDLKEDDIVIMFHGAIEKSKGLDVLLEAAKILVQKYSNLYFFVVGNGTAFSDFEESVNRCGMDSRVILTGWIDLKKIPNFINGADVGIALRSENKANHFVVTTALMQYWACEKPLLAPGLDSIREVVVDGENALLFEPGNKSDLVEKIQHMIEIRDKWPEMGRRGRGTVEENFEKTKIGREMTDLLLSYVN